MIAIRVLTAYLLFNVVSATFDSPIDLSWDYNENTVFWPNTRGFSFTKKVANVSEGGYWYAMNEFCTGEHGGTHFDAPYHFNKNGMKVGEVPLERLITRGICIDLKSKTKEMGRNTTLLTDDIIAWEKQHGRIMNNSIVLVNFGWTQYYNTKHYLYNSDKQLDFPGISKEAAELLADRHIYGVGLDTASVDPGTSVEYYSHRILTEHNIFILENVKLHEDLPATGFKLYTFPMKIKEGTGAPVRIVAIPESI